MATSPGPPAPEGTAAAPPPDRAVVTPRRRGLARRLVRALRWLVLGSTAVVVALVVAAAVIDLGPALRERAEREASKQIARPMHIGRLSISLLRGRFVFDDLRIDGLTPSDRPFFTARRVEVRMPWWTAFRREIFFDAIVVSDWQMLIESFPNGRHNFIRIPTRKPGGPRRFTTTVQLVRATRGVFTYEDHVTPWSVVAPNVDVTIAKLRGYRGEGRASGGTVRIQRYEPMGADLYTTFQIDGGKVRLDRIDLDTDGAVSKVTGEVDLGRWPEQIYHVRSQIQFPRMREIFWAGQDFSLHGDGTFTGFFHLFKGGRELAGDFQSPEAGINEYRFQDLRGHVRWLPRSLEVTDTTSRLYGGRQRLTFTMMPLGVRTPATARLDAAYQDVDLAAFTEAIDLPGLRLAGRATGRNLLEWTVGRWSDHRGHGEAAAQPPPGVTLMARVLPEGYDAEYAAREAGTGPFDRQPLRRPLAIGGRVAYRYGPEWIDIAPSEVASPSTFVAFEGRTAYGARSTVPFHVTSGDWQESDRVLAAIIGAFGSPTRAIPVGGYGVFDGVVLGDFARPRVEGQASGEQLRAWDVTWGHGEGRLVVENSYVDITEGVVARGDARMDVEGRFSLGYPRRDGGQEIDARVRLARWTLADLKHAFLLDDYDVVGLASGEFHLYDRYERPLGFGRLQLDELVAYGEPIAAATASLRFEGAGVRLDGIEAVKGTGRITGAAYVGWEGTYSFNADGRAIPVESLAATAYPRAPLSGTLQFTASGAGVFENPRYEVRARVDDLFVVDEGIGQVRARLVVRDNQLVIDQLEAASPRLAISGSGRVAMTAEGDAELQFRFSDTSLDPYVRALGQNLSPYTTAVASGTLRLSGPTRTPGRLRAELLVEQAELGLFDYRMRNDGNLRLYLNDQQLRVDRFRLVGEGTALEVFGDVDLGARRVALRGLGDVNLGVLQGFMRDIRSSGAAEVQAEVRGSLSQPVVLGSATLVDGRVRHFSLPHAIEALNGRIEFDAGGVRFDDLRGRLGGGEVTFGGRIGFNGVAPVEYAITATGRDMRIRYPEGFRSLIDADLVLRGPVARPTLSGSVLVNNATWNGSFDVTGSGLFRVQGSEAPRPAPQAAAGSAFPLAFDVRVEAPGTLRIQNRAVRLTSSADLTLRGTYEKPLLFGRVEVLRGEVLFEGNRYQVTRGTFDFANPNKIEPFFDIEAETRVRVPGETYRVVFRATGTPEQMGAIELTSDPPLSQVDILTILFGDPRDPNDPELRNLRAPGRAEQDLLAARATRLLVSPVSSEVSRVFEQTFGVDTVQITPSLGDVWTQQLDRISPSARLTVGKRISERVFLTYSRALSTSTQDQVILVEYNQSDRLSWIVSQNEDRTYALNVRVRHVF